MDDAWPRHRGYPYFPEYFWDHYTEYPDIYDRFAVSTDAGVDFLETVVSLAGASVLDVAAGTGRTAFALSRHGAERVVGIEPDPLMRAFALCKKAELGTANVEFLEGSTASVPSFEPGSFDLVTCFHGPPFSPREIRHFVDAFGALVRPGGKLIVQTAIPGWLHEFQRGLPPDVPERRIVADPERVMERAYLDHGFRYVDADLLADHTTMEDALGSYGLIYGPAAIDWLLEGSRSTVPWGMRSYIFNV